MSGLGGKVSDRPGTTRAIGRAPAGPASDALGSVPFGGLRRALNDQLRTGTDWGNLTV